MTFKGSSERAFEDRGFEGRRLGNYGWIYGWISSWRTKQDLQPIVGVCERGRSPVSEE